MVVFEFSFPTIFNRVRRRIGKEIWRVHLVHEPSALMDGPHASASQIIMSASSSIKGLLIISLYCHDGMKYSLMPSVHAFAAALTHHTFRPGSRGWVVGNNNLHRTGTTSMNPLHISNNHSDSDVEGIDQYNNILTSAVIKCAYDGTYFRGWTAGNSDLRNVDHDGKSEDINDDKHPPKRKQTRRSRNLQRKGMGCGTQRGKVRTVDDTIRFTLAKIYGNIHANRISIEACSRTDAGVHAHSLVAQFFCAKTSSPTTGMTTRPTSHDDTSNFLPLPFGSDLSKLVFVLNRMLPPDVRVLAASPLPSMPCYNTSVPFHPALHTISKTYTYKFAIGSNHDPLRTQYVWHLDGSSNRAVGMNGKRFRLERALAASNLFVDSKDKNMAACTADAKDYGAFRSAFRGTDRGRIQSTICKLWKCEIVQERKKQLPSWENATDGSEDSLMQTQSLGLHYDDTQTFTVIITGDRFLYKMIRNIVGTIVAVGCGHLDLNDVRVALAAGKWDEYSVGENSQSRRICAPARGLTLAEVNYPQEMSFDWQTG